MPLIATRGAASAQGFGEFAQSAAPNYIEDVFSTWLYTGTGANQTITNGIDLAGKGGLTWIKQRTLTRNHNLFDTTRGATKSLFSDSTSGQITGTTTLTSFNANGFSLGDDSDIFGVNLSSQTYASWTFRKQPKFFDVVTWTGDGTDNRAITHSLGSVPGCIIVKNTSSVVSWAVKHRSLTASQYLVLNDTAAPATTLNPWSTDPTSSVFYVNGSGSSISNGAGFTYVAYIFAHNSGGFGLTGTDNVISCSSVTTDGSGNATVDLGYEPQFVMIKSLDAGQDWNMVDTMRGLAVSNFAYNGARLLTANTSSAESSAAFIQPSSTGFGLSFFAGSSQTYVYIAIRRGPMKVPTTGTSVYYPFARAGNDTQTNITGVGFTPDLWMVKDRTIAAAFPFFDRLRGVTRRVESDSTNAEQGFSGSNGLVSLNMDGITIGAGALDGGICNDTGSNYGNWLLKRAPGFFDEVCYTGTGVDLIVNHNLGVVPEWVIIKNRSRAGTNWSGAYFANASEYYDVRLNQDIGRSLITMGPLGPTLVSNSATTFGVYGGSTLVNFSGDTYVAYLFASCPGVSKVGGFTGTGATQVINCGFTGGARFVLIKATSTTGDWYVWDSARGIVSGNDPYLRFNTTAAEVTTTDWVDTAATGFELSNAGGNLANSNGVTYIFLAIA